MANKIKRYFQLPLALFISVNIAGSCTAGTKPSIIATSYQSSSENFSNPERGFYQSVDPISTDDPGSPLQLSKLQKVRSDNMSMIRRYYLLSEFRDKAISQSFLDRISNDLKTARQAGVKLIIRFTYNWGDGNGAPTDSDASRDRILAHLDQLKPILQANYDAIAYMEAGFIGYWGEWHNSFNNLLDPKTGKITEDSRKIFLKILSVLPTERMVAVRYFKHKKQILNNDEALTLEQAFDGSIRARTGYHNDAFRANIHDAGTYNSGDAYDVDQEKAWLNLETRYVVQGGEPAWASEPAEYDDCPNALTDFARMHWSAMSINQPFAGAVYQGWKDQGCMEEIKRRLGYRFRLINSKIPDRVKPAGTFSMNFKVINDGWASPYNPRSLEVILRHRQTGKEYYLPVPEAVRMWMPGEMKKVKIVGGIPANIPPGEYRVLLNLPDPTPRLHNRPEYSIRLANKDIWEAPTGYNSLLRSLVIDPNAEGENYSANQFFKSH